MKASHTSPGVLCQQSDPKSQQSLPSAEFSVSQECVIFGVPWAFGVLVQGPDLHN